MKKRSNDFLLGGVILVAIALVIAVSLFLRETDIGTKRHQITARFRDVGQVQVGNAVVIRGVKAGRVERVALAAEGWVHVLISLDEQVALPPNPVLLLGASSLFGEWQATVTGRQSVPANKELYAQLAEASGDKDGALPGAVLPDIAQLTSVAGGIAGDVASTAQRFQVAFSDSAARELRASIHSVSRMSGDLARTVSVQSKNLDTIAVDVRSGALALSKASDAFLRNVARLDSATSGGEVQRIVKESALAATQVREASERLNKISQSFEKTEGSLRSVMFRADSVLIKVDKGQGTLGMMVNDPGLYRHTDSVMVDIRALIADIKKNPRRYIKLSIF
jgi:phospholipid/cholesterol/gamma-HCH transport system substrate-binding protein